jgi:hypothetical protein
MRRPPRIEEIGDVGRPEEAGHPDPHQVTLRIDLNGKFCAHRRDR